MGKDYDVLKNGKVVDYSYGFYELKDAERYAQGQAKAHPGHSYLVVQRLSEYRIDKLKGDI